MGDFFESVEGKKKPVLSDVNFSVYPHSYKFLHFLWYNQYVVRLICEHYKNGVPVKLPSLATKTRHCPVETNDHPQSAEDLPSYGRREGQHEVDSER